MNPCRLQVPFLVAASLVGASAPAADIVKADNTTALNLGGSWTGGTAPSSLDVALFNLTYATGGTLNTGGLVSWAGIKITDAGAAVVINNSTAGQEVALGASGIDMSLAAQNLTLQRLRIDASQTWNIASGRTFNLGNSASARLGALTVNGAGGFTVTKSGAGTVQLDTSNTAIGLVNWRVEGGLIRAIWNQSSAWGTGTITLAGGGIATGTNFTGSVGNWTWNNAVSLATGTSSFIDNQNIAGSGRWLKLTGVWSGSGNLEFRDTGTGFDNVNFGFIVGATNTHTGTVTITSAAEVRVGAAAATDLNANTGNNGKLAGDTAAVVLNGKLTFSRLDAHTVANDISGTGTLQVGLGTTVGTSTSTQNVTLSGSNSYSGGTELLNGTLTVDGLGRIGTGYLAVKGGGTFSYGGATASTTRGLFLNAGAAVIDIVNAGTVLTWSDTSAKGGVNGGLITKAGAGTLELSGAIAAGGATAVTVSGGTLRLSGANTYDGATTVASGATLDLSGAGTLAATTTVSLAGTLAVSTSANQTLSSAITGAGALAKSGAGTLTLSSTGNTFAGGTTVSGGILALGAANVLADAGAVTVSGGIFDLGGFSETVGAVTLSSGTIRSGTLTSTLGFSLSGGAIASTASLAGSVGLSKTGAGAATIAGTHAYTGATQVSAGTLILASGAQLATTSLMIGQGATLDVVDGLVVGSGRTLALGAGTTVAAGNLLGGLTLSGGTLGLDFGATTNDRLDITGDLTLASGSLAFTKAGSYVSGVYTLLTYTGAYNPPGLPSDLSLVGLSSDGTSRQTFELTHDELAKALQLTVGGSSANVRWTGAAGTTWDAGETGAANWIVTDASYEGLGDRFYNSDAVTFADVSGGAAQTVQIAEANVTPAGVAFTGDVNAYTLTSAGGVIESGTLTKSGAALLTLAVSNTYAGGSTLSAGRTRLGASQALGTGTLTLAGGALSSDGATARSLANAVVVTADTTLGHAADNGLLTFSGPIDLGDAARTLTLASDVTLTGTLGNGTLTKSGSGRLTLNAANALQASATIQAGTLAFARSDVVLDSASLTVSSGATLDLGGFSETLASLTVSSGASATSGTVTAAVTVGDAAVFNLALAGGSSLTKTGTANLTLLSASTRTGTTTLSGGGLLLGDAAALGTGAVTLNAGRLALADATARTVANTLALGGNVTLGASGSGALTFSGAVGLGGATRTVTVDSLVVLGGVVSNGALAKAGAGTLRLTAANTFASLAVQAGAVDLAGAANSLGTASVALTAGSELILGMTTANLTLANVLTGSGRITKANTNRFFLSGDNSGAVLEWYWNITDTAGTTGGLGFNTGASLGGAGSVLRVAAGATGNVFMNANGQTTAVGVDIGSGGTFTWNGSTGNTTVVAGVISGSGTFSKVSGETLQLSGVSTHTGPLSTTGGSLEIIGAGQLGSGSYAGAIAIGGTRLFVNSTASQSFSGVVSGAGRIDKSNTGTLTLSGVNTYGGGTELLGGTLSVSALSGIGTGYLAVKNGATFVYSGAGSETTARNLFLDLGASVIQVSQAGAVLTWNDAAAKTGPFAKTGSGTLSVGGAFSGAATITVDGGRLILRGANTFSGAISVNGGVLEIGGAGSLGGGAYAGALGLTGDLAWSSSATQTLSGAITGSGALGVSAGALTLSSASLRTGTTSVTGGTLILGHADALGGGAVALGAAGTLRLGYALAAPQTFGASLTGTGTLDIAVTGGQTLSLAPDTAFAGSVRLTSGILNPGAWTGSLLYAGGSLTDGFDAFTGSVTVVSGSTYEVATQGMPSDLRVVTGGAIDFAGVSGGALGVRIRWAGGSLLNASAYTGTVAIGADDTLAAGAFGNGLLELGSGRSVTLGAGLLNSLRLTASDVTLSGLAAYAGTVRLAAGVTFSSGTAEAPLLTSAGFLLESGSRLAGNGTLGDTTVASGGVLAPGNSPGILSFSNLTLQGGGVLDFQVLHAESMLGGPPEAGLDYDTVSVAGTLDLTGLSAGNRFLIRLLSLASTSPDVAGDAFGFDPAGIYTFDLYSYGTLLGGASLTSLFTLDTTGFTHGGLPVSAANFSVVNNVAEGKIQLTYSAIPEPSTYGLAFGLLALASVAVRRRAGRHSGTAARN